jgi:hypothetical protein
MKPRKTTRRWHRQEALSALLKMYQEIPATWQSAKM